MTASSKKLLQPAESAYLGRVFTDIEQTLAVVGTCTTTESLSMSFSQSFNVLKSTDASVLFKAAATNDIDLIIFCAQGEKAMWVESLRKIRSHSILNAIPVIVLTEHNSVNEQLIALELGALDCMAKPANPFVLHAKVANYMKLMKNVKELELVSSTDGLTGLSNKMQLETMVTSEWYRMKRSQSPLSSLMIDIDYFKPYNDKYGHLAGDEALKAVAAVIKNVASRNSDFAARFGGEEFVVLLPSTDADGAEKVAKDILDEVSALDIPSANQELPQLTVSIGISSFEPHCLSQQDKSPGHLLDQADKQLYRAKQRGRNRYCR
ncbi:diguanylate cyclase [Paraglaciecola aquimarina]|uniref:diguanylate cyclase n=1 Tax=Paraglaciecola aquimarina TaxID=1235557 RepID=A0ABU3SSJ5_9ALTE|nr:diguanylate cyclase [Paraglaciecola aquimarina]MDU0352985.1 diguanylate cyclase [Paraglaciecola aquimarina]